MLEKRLPSLDPAAERSLHTAIPGAQRGAALTRRMLAFARQQRLEPDRVDPSAIIGGLENLLAHTLGPSLRIVAHVMPDTWPLHAELNQLEMALINLAINARDAMPACGVVTIAARNEIVALTAPSAFFADAVVHDLTPGDYVAMKRVNGSK